MRDEFFSDWLEYRRGNMERPDPADYEDEPTDEVMSRNATDNDLAANQLAMEDAPGIVGGWLVIEAAPAAEEGQ